MSSIVQGVEYLTTELGSKEDLLDALKGWAGEQGLDIAAVMTVSRPEGKFTRELLVWAFGMEAVGVVKGFVEREGERLGLERWGEGEMDADGEQEARWCWTQGRVENSRKQVAPMLREAMREGSKL
jgi:exopolyphosphatase